MEKTTCIHCDAVRYHQNAVSDVEFRTIGEREVAHRRSCTVAVDAGGLESPSLFAAWLMKATPGQMIGCQCA